MVGFCTSPRFYDHQTGPHHPERPDRIRAIFAAVREAGLVASPNPLPSDDLSFGLSPWTGEKLVEIEPRPATVEEIMLVHPHRHVERVRLRSEYGGLLDSGDTVVGHDSYEIALLSAGACVRCVDAVMTGEVRRAFAAVRPPGHHAEPNAAMGFCVFSNVAIATKYAVQKYGLKRVAIVDFDVHHGNGTQAVFQTDPSVLFISMHEDPHTLFPGTGFKWEIGSAEGKGFTLNIPMPLRSRDQEYLEVMSRCVIPKLKAFEPELMLVSAGFDAHRDDPLADEDLTEDGFGQMTRMLVETADEFCDGRIVSVLEGGYNLRALGRSVVSHLIAMA